MLKFIELIRNLFALIAEQVLKKEWCELHKSLSREYSKHLCDSECKPSLTLQRLLISGEDHRFFWHPGFDPIAICRAIYRWIFLGRKEGASTIEQQTVRVLTGRYECTLCRKVREIFLATLITRVIPKHDIPAVYLRIAYYGWQMNSFIQACRRLNLQPKRILFDEAAELIARLKYPEPKIPPLKRRVQILRRRDHLIRLYAQYFSNAYNFIKSKEDLRFESI